MMGTFRLMMNLGGARVMMLTAVASCRKGVGLSYRRMVRQVATHVLVAVVSFTVAYYGFAVFALGAAINKCGTDTEYPLGQSSSGEKIGMSDSVCDFLSPGHDVQIYRIGADDKRSESILHYSTNIFHMPRAGWTAQGKLVVEVPPARFLSTDPYVKRNVTIEFRRVL